MIPAAIVVKEAMLPQAELAQNVDLAIMGQVTATVHAARDTTAASTSARAHQLRDARHRGPPCRPDP